VLGTLLALALVLASMDLWIHLSVPAMVFLVVLGIAAFATVAPLQVRVLDQAAGAGQNLASSLNIAAFNLGNALGAWVGGLVIDHGPGLRALGAAGAVLTLAGLGLALWSRALERRGAVAAGTPAPSQT
jgi:DHA1 family inner membrane transport protein